MKKYDHFCFKDKERGTVAHPAQLVKERVGAQDRSIGPQCLGIYAESCCLLLVGLQERICYIYVINLTN